MARSTFYYHFNKLKAPDKYHEIKIKIEKIFNKHFGTYGYRRITDELHKQGDKINHKTVYRLMKEMRLKSLVRPKRYSSFKGDNSYVANNELKRDFNSDMPNKKWVTDVTEFRIQGRKIYLSPVMDLFNREIISHEISFSPNLQMVKNMINKAFKRNPVTPDLIIHSDQGGLYKSHDYQNTLKKRNIKQSMSRKGNCLDNACIESFFGTLKSELLYLRRFSSVDSFIKQINEYIYYYNNIRIKSRLNKMSPVEYRAHYYKNNKLTV